MMPNHSSSSIGVLSHASIQSKNSVARLPDLRILHFNDVYNIAGFAKEPVGGIARFESRINHYRDGKDFQGQPELLTLFSGDCLNPSLESIFTKGRHMIEILNRVGVKVACVGNHELDFGVPHFQELKKDCTFPWLIANVLDPALGDNVPLGNCQKTAMVVWNNIKIGLIGLAEREWLPTVYQLPANIVYKSASATALELIPELKKQGANLIIALTHQREPNDEKLAEKTHGLIDIILAGHDHFYRHHVVNGTHIVRSGCDFQQLSYLELRKNSVLSSRSWDIRVVREDITESVPEDPLAADWAKSLASSLRPQMNRPVGCTAVELDARFTTVRREESNMGNFVTDLMRCYYRADCAVIAAGTIRGNQVYPPGVLTIKDIRECYSFDDPCVVLSLTGEAIQAALENAVSLYPALEARFPQVSNISFDLHPSRPPHSRITNIYIGTEALDPTKLYRLATTDYIACGKLDFTSLRGTSAGGIAKELTNADEGLHLHQLILRYFSAPEEFEFGDGIEMVGCCSGVAATTATVSGSSSVAALTPFSSYPQSSASSSHSSEVDEGQVDIETEAETEAGAKDNCEAYSSSSSSDAGSDSDDKDKEEAKVLNWISPKIDGRIRIVDT